MTPTDWYGVEFYRRVSDQVVNQAPMGTDSGDPWVNPRLEGYLAALEIYGYPREEWTWLCDVALLLHRYVRGGETLTATEMRTLNLEAVTDGD